MNHWSYKIYFQKGVLSVVKKAISSQAPNTDLYPPAYLRTGSALKLRIFEPKHRDQHLFTTNKISTNVRDALWLVGLALMARSSGTPSSSRQSDRWESAIVKENVG